MQLRTRTIVGLLPPGDGLPRVRHQGAKAWRLQGGDRQRLLRRRDRTARPEGRSRHSNRKVRGTVPAQVQRADKEAGGKLGAGHGNIGDEIWAAQQSCDGMSVEGGEVEVSVVRGYDQRGLSDGEHGEEKYDPSVWWLGDLRMYFFRYVFIYLVRLTRRYRTSSFS